MSNRLHIDFETRSVADLKKVGTDVYSKHPTTDVWCMAFAFDDEDVGLVRFIPHISGYLCAGWDDDLDRMAGHIANGGIVVAHKASFELAIWNNLLVSRWNWPELPVEQVRCTMAMSYAMGLPGDLDRATGAVGLPDSKDMEGHRLMLRMARPRKVHDDGTIVWWDEPDKLGRLYAYCRQDVVSERNLDKRVYDLSASEQRIWTLDHTINNRGIPIDVKAVKKAIEIKELEKKTLDERMHALTGGEVSACTNVTQLKKWLEDFGLTTPGVSKNDLDALLAQDDLPNVCRQAIRLRQQAAKSSVAKLDKMMQVVSEDGRIRNTMQYHGPSTGRWAGRMIQPQNLPRPDIKQWEIEEVLDELDGDESPAELQAKLEVLHGPPIEIISDCLRGFISAPPGHTFFAADFSNVEGRKLAWLAGEERKLDVFRAFDAGQGHDPYLVTAGGILGAHPLDTKPHRLVFGKVPELALGFQGGPGAFDSMGRVYGVDIAEHYDSVVSIAKQYHIDKALDDYERRGKEKDHGVEDKKRWVAGEIIKLGWREQHPNIVAYWRALQDAATNAILNPGEVFTAGAAGREIKYRMAGSFLWCQLPSGRVICYPYPSIKYERAPWADDDDPDPQMIPSIRHMGVDSKTYKWKREATYGGKLSENVTQASSSDILREAMLRAEAAGYPIVFHVHDEAVAEVPSFFGSLEEYEQIMSVVPDWAEGMPIAAEGWCGTRYRK